MIERLINPEHSCGEPQYSQLSKQISAARQSLEELLTPDALRLLQQMEEDHLRQETVLIRGAFAEGFAAALELLADIYRPTFPPL